MEINCPENKPFSEVDVVGIAVTGDSQARQNHVAILYVFDEEDPEPRLLHLAAHRQLISNQPNDSYIWLDLGDSFDDIDRAIICAHVQKVADANPRDSAFYGFDFDGKYIDPETGEFRKTMPAIGLTCATFLLEVFLSCGYQLIQSNSWPRSQKADIKWQKEMIEVFLEQPGVSQEFLERQRKNVGNRRYLPEEVAAATQGDIPVVRGKVKKPALDLRKIIKKRAQASS